LNTLTRGLKTVKVWVNYNHTFLICKPLVNIFNLFQGIEMLRAKTIIKLIEMFPDITADELASRVKIIDDMIRLL